MDTHSTSTGDDPIGRASADVSERSVLVIGDLCLDDNEVDGRDLAPSWGSPALFIARHLRLEYGITPVVSGAYGEDLLPLITEFSLDRGPTCARSLSYRNIVEPVHPHDSGSAHARVQYWRPATCEPYALSGADIPADAELVYFCPLTPDLDRVADIQTIASAAAATTAVKVLLAQGLMRVSGQTNGTAYRRVERRDITDSEALTWACFDIVVFSDEDLQDAIAKATRWSAAPGAHETGFIVTEGELGATVCFRGDATRVPTRPVAHETSPVGAGDVFGATVGLEFRNAVRDGLDRHDALLRAVAAATAAASRHVANA